MFLATPMAIEFQQRAGTTPSQFGAAKARAGSAAKRPARSGTGAVV
jgi:hypothetical protein